MNYIYDIVLNFSDYNCSFDFYEWSRDDKIFEIKKIPIFRINRLIMSDIINYNIKVTDDFLKIINNETLLNNNKVINNCALFCDLNKVVALKFDDVGNIESRSTLLFDEEDSIIDEVYKIDEYTFLYEKKGCITDCLFLTRKEKFIRTFLINKINKLYEDCCFDEIKYLYSEIYDDRLSIKKKYEKLIYNLNENYNSSFNKLYDILMISCK